MEETLSGEQVILNFTEKDRNVMHFNRKFNEDPSVPMWVVKRKGETHYVDHIISEVPFNTKETPENPHTKGSILLRGKLKIINSDGRRIAVIT
jgi:hypothetical protein